ncbi:MAG TPA: hypothetical protein VF970_04965 [Gemmatimonadales bacterium]
MAQFTVGDAAEAGRKGGQAKASARQARAAAAQLTAEEVSAGLEAMTTPDAIRRNLDTVAKWAACGRLSAGHAGAIVRACSEALRAIELGTELDQLGELRARLDALDAEKRPRPRAV